MEVHEQNKTLETLSLLLVFSMDQRKRKMLFCVICLRLACTKFRNF